MSMKIVDGANAFRAEENLAEAEPLVKALVDRGLVEFTDVLVSIQNARERLTRLTGLFV